MEINENFDATIENEKREVYPKIAIFAQRHLSDRLSAFFLFVKQNWKIVSRYMLYYNLPLILLLSVVSMVFMHKQVEVMNNYADYDLTLTFDILIALYLIVGIAYGLVNSGVSFSLLSLYQEKLDGLDGIGLSDVWLQVPHKMLRSFKAWLTLITLCAIPSLFCVIPIFMYVNSYGLSSMVALCIILFLCIVLSLFMLPVIVMTVSVYVYDDSMTFCKAIKKCFRLGFKTYWSLLVFSFLVFMCVYVVVFIASIPYMLVMLVSMVSAFMSGCDGLMSTPFMIANALSYAIVLSVTSIIMPFVSFAFLLHYGNAVVTVPDSEQ